MKKLEFMDEVELKKLMSGLAHAVELTATEFFGVEKPQFCLLVFNDPKTTQYVANVDRITMIEVLRESANRLENREDVQR